MECSQQNMKGGQRAKDGMSGTTIMLREREMLDREGTVRGLVRAQGDGFHGDQRKRQQEVIIIATFYDLSFSELGGGCPCFTLPQELHWAVTL